MQLHLYCKSFLGFAKKVGTGREKKRIKCEAGDPKKEKVLGRQKMENGLRKSVKKTVRPVHV